MDQREAIKKELLRALKEFLPKGPEPTEEVHLIKDLHLHGDDASELILLVQKRLGIRPPLKEWQHTGTVGQVIDLFLKYAPQRG